MSTIEERLQALEDERDILHVLYTYGHAMDYGIELEKEFADIWTEDAVLHHSYATFVGRDRIMAAFHAHTHAPDAYHKHCLVEPRIMIVGNEATSVAYTFALWDFGDAPALMAFGRYKDVLVRCDDGRWRIRERRVENECNMSPAEIEARNRSENPAKSHLFDLPEAIARREQMKIEGGSAHKP